MRAEDNYGKSFADVAGMADEADLGHGYTIKADAKPDTDTPTQKTGDNHIGDVARELIKSMIKQNEGGKPCSVLSGFPCIESRAGGAWLNNQELTVVAARPGIGKTSFGLQIAEFVATSGKSVYVVSAEMSSIQLTRRRLSRDTSIPISRLKSADVSTDEWNCIADAMEKLNEIPIYINDQTRAVDELFERVTTIKEVILKEGNPELGLIVVDYIQKLTGKGANKNLEIGYVSGQLLELAKKFDVPVLALAQMNRGIENRKGDDALPGLADLRDSGSIEQDANIVMFLHRERHDPEGKAKVIFEKNRDGDTCTVDIQFIGKEFRFDDSGSVASTAAPSKKAVKKGVQYGNA